MGFDGSLAACHGTVASDFGVRPSHIRVPTSPLMNPQELLRIVDSTHREKNIDSELVFEAIEAALETAMVRVYGETAEVSVSIARESGVVTAIVDGEPLDQEIIGRIGAQTAKQIMIQKLREAERDARMEEFSDQVGQLVTGVVHRNERGVTIVQLGGVEAILPRSEQIPGESYHNGERVRAVIYEVKSSGNRVKIVLSRTHSSLILRLFEQEIPEIAENVIEIKSISREAGYRSKVAVFSSDSRVDCVGACVGMRGNRIKNITSELAGERIDIVRWSDDPKVMIPNALQPADVEQVLLCDMIGRAIALVDEEHLSQAIGRYGQNVKLASKLCGWDIEIMTAEELEQQIERAVEDFMSIEGMSDEVAQQLVEQGFLSFDDLSVIEPDELAAMGGWSEEEVMAIVEQAEERALEREEAEAERKRIDRERQALAADMGVDPATLMPAALAAASAAERAEAAAAEGVANAAQADVELDDSGDDMDADESDSDDEEAGSGQMHDIAIAAEEAQALANGEDDLAAVRRSDIAPRGDHAAGDVDPDSDQYDDEALQRGRMSDIDARNMADMADAHSVEGSAGNDAEESVSTADSDGVDDPMQSVSDSSGGGGS